MSDEDVTATERDIGLLCIQCGGSGVVWRDDGRDRCPVCRGRGLLEPADHPWLGDEDGHNCAGCERYDDALRLCWSENHPPFDEWVQTADHWGKHQDHDCARCDEGFRFWNSIAALRLRQLEATDG